MVNDVTPKRKKLPFDRRIFLYAALFSVVGLFDLVAIYYSLYFYHEWLDIPVHFIAGFILGGFFYYIFFTNRKTWSVLRLKNTEESIFTTVVFWVFVTAVAWEIIELWYGRVKITPAYFPDTFLDICVGTFGALVFYAIHRWLVRRHHKRKEKRQEI